MACTLPRAPAGRALCERRKGLVQGSSSRCLAAQTQRCTECTRLPGSLAGVCSPTHPEADSLGAQQLPHTRSFPSALLPSRDVCSWLGPAPACLGSAHSPSSGQAAPEPRPAGGAERPHLEAECTAGREANLLEGRRGSPASFGSSPTWLEPSAPPGRQSSSSAQRPDLAELLARGCSALGEPCPDLPHS